MALNTSGLNEAYLRKQKGTANQTDLANLSYAESKGWKAPAINPSIDTATPKNSDGELINPTASDIAQFNNKYTTYTPTNKIDSNTFSLGLQNSGIAGQLPTSNNLATSLYTDRSLEDATKQQASLQAELDKFKAQRITDTEAALKAEQENLKNIQAQKDTQIQNYDSQMQPLKDKAVGIYDSMLNSIKDTNYSELTKQKLDLTNEIVNYSKMAKEELDSVQGGGLTSVITGRKNDIIENYTAKISLAQAAQQAIDGNFNLAFDIMDRGYSAIENLTNDRINFINTVQSLFSTKEDTSLNNILRLTSDEKEQLDNAVKDAQAKLDNLQKNKETIMEIMQTNPIIANKAGLSLTDTPEQITEKLNNFYVKNPQYTPDNQEIIKKAMEKYIDAGITMNDSIATVQSKIKQSKIYQNEVISNANKIDDNTNNNSLLTPGTVGGQCGDYVHKIVDNVPSLGDTYEEKIQKANVSTNQWQIGDVLIQKTRLPYGHVSVVTAVNGNQVTVTESNWNLDEKVGTRTLNIGDPSVTGVYRGGTIKNIAQKNLSESAKAVLNNPLLLNNYTNTRKGEIIDEISAAGLPTDNLLTKPLSDTAIKEVEQTKSALASLDVLEEKIKENLEYVGPISGWQKLNPWSKARQVQADVDRVRQTVGKALEGGVLRKEDEEKYKKILATLTDTPETAIYKIQALRDTLTRDVESYLSSQQASGRYVDGIQTKSSSALNANELRSKYDY